MTINKKPAPGGNRETGYGDAFDCRNCTAIHARIQSVIVRLAVWGVIPADFATWLIQRGGLKDA